jgi:DNA-binding NtrC family response regulator
MVLSISAGKSSVTRAVIPTRVLVVDDEPLIRWSISTALQAEGFEVIAASDAGDAQALAEEWPPPKVAVVDGRLSTESGCSLVKALRQIYPECRFLIMTTSPREIECFAQVPGIQVIHKPFDLTRVVRVVSELAA